MTGKFKKYDMGEVVYFGVYFHTGMHSAHQESIDFDGATDFGDITDVCAELWLSHNHSNMVTNDSYRVFRMDMCAETNLPEAVPTEVTQDIIDVLKPRYEADSEFAPAFFYGWTGSQLEDEMFKQADDIKAQKEHEGLGG